MLVTLKKIVRKWCCKWAPFASRRHGWYVRSNKSEHRILDVFTKATVNIALKLAPSTPGTQGYGLGVTNLFSKLNCCCFRYFGPVNTTVDFFFIVILELRYQCISLNKVTGRR